MINKMNSFKWIGLGFCLFALSACSPQNEKSYLATPKALQEAMKNCPENPPKNVTCEQINEMATRINQLVYKLQVDQQGFGKDILALQQTITMERHSLQKNPTEATLQKNLKQNERQLQEHLAVVRWLESPRQH